jgi:hypothetical protein
MIKTSADSTLDRPSPSIGVQVQVGNNDVMHVDMLTLTVKHQYACRQQSCDNQTGFEQVQQSLQY